MSPKKTFVYEHTIDGEFCCHQMEIRWGRHEDEFIKELKVYLSARLVNFCPFCGKEMTIEKDD